MALKCPECGTVAHARTAAYEAPSVNARGISARIWNVPAHLRHWRVWIR